MSDERRVGFRDALGRLVRHAEARGWTDCAVQLETGIPEDEVVQPNPEHEAAVLALYDALLAENARLRRVIRRVADCEWIISTAYNGTDFGHQVNARDAVQQEEGPTRYTAMPGTFAENPADAGLLGLVALERPATP